MAQIIGSISTEYGLDLKQFHSDLKKIKKELKKLEQDAQKVSIGVSSIGGSRGSRASTASQTSEQAKALAAQSRATRQAINDFERLDSARFKAQLAQTDLNGKIRLYEQRLKSVAPATTEYYKNQERLATLNQRAANSSRGLATSLQGISSAAGALGIGFGSAASEVANITKELVQYGNEVEDTITSAEILAGSQEEYARILALARKEQRLFGTSYTEAVQNATNFSVVARNQSVELERLFGVTQRLASSDTQQGIEGASIAIKELFSGSSSSLKLRFETFSAEQIEALGQAGLTANERLELLDETLNDLGFTQETLDERLNNTSQTYRDLGIAVDEAKQELAKFTAEGLEPAARGLQRLLDNDTEAIAASLKQSFNEYLISQPLIQFIGELNQNQEMSATLARDLQAEFDKLAETTDELATSTGNATNTAGEQSEQSELNVTVTEELVDATKSLDNAENDLSDTTDTLTGRFSTIATEARNLVKDYQDLADAAEKVKSVEIPEGAEVEAGTGRVPTRGQQEGRRREQEFEKRQKERKEAAEVAEREREQEQRLAEQAAKEAERVAEEQQRSARRQREEEKRAAERAAEQQIKEAERAQQEKERLAEQAARELEQQREEEQRIFERQQDDLRKQADAWRDYYKDRQRSSIDFRVDRERAKEDFEQERRRLLAEGQIAEADRLTQEFEKEERRAQEDFAREQAREKEDRQREAALEQDEFSREYGVAPVVPAGSTTQQAVQQQAVQSIAPGGAGVETPTPQPLNIPMNVSLLVDGQKLAEAIGEEMTEIVVDNLAVSLSIGEQSSPANAQSSNYRTTRGI
jgi:hypothetical protein